MRKYVALIVALCGLYPVFAQKDGTSNALTNGQLWNEVNLTHAHRKLVFQLDLLLNYSNDSSDEYNIAKHYINWGVRGWANYYITPRVKLSATLSYQYNADVPPVLQYQTRDIQQGIMAQHFLIRKRITLYNRLRFDNRFLEQENGDTYKYTARLRYMPKVVLALNSNVIRKKSIYFLAYDEVFMPFGKGPPIVSLNMLCAGFGYCITSDVIVEVAYTNQYKYRANLSPEITNALGLTLSINNVLSVVKKKKN